MASEKLIPAVLDVFDLGVCDRDGCDNSIGERGWMKKTGREDQDTGLPIAQIFCSGECSDG